MKSLRVMLYLLFLCAAAATKADVPTHPVIKAFSSIRPVHLFWRAQKDTIAYIVYRIDCKEGVKADEIDACSGKPISLDATGHTDYTDFVYVDTKYLYLITSVDATGNESNSFASIMVYVDK